jgi:hypothetical protein
MSVGDNSDESILQLFQIYRDYVKHEDGLINFRVTWFIATQAAIFAAYGFLVHDTLKRGPFLALADGQPVTPLFAAVMLLCTLGGLSSVTSFFSIHAALIATRTVHRRWRDHVLRGVEREWLPDIVGGGNALAPWFGWLSARTLPAVSLAVWVGIACAHLSMLPLRFVSQ